MSPTSIGGFNNDLGASLLKAWALLDDGVRDSDTMAHHPVVASVDSNGAPSQRVLILRGLDLPARALRFQTDSRSDKIDQFVQHSAASVLIYEPSEKIQLRLGGVMEVQRDNAVADAAWAQSSAYSRRCYLAERAPGTPLPAPGSGLPKEFETKEPSEQELEPARANFATLMFHFGVVEWLYLAHKGHRRARWHWNSADARWDGQWLVP